MFIYSFRIRFLYSISCGVHLKTYLTIKKAMAKTKVFVNYLPKTHGLKYQLISVVSTLPALIYAIYLCFELYRPVLVDNLTSTDTSRSSTSWYKSL